MKVIRRCLKTGAINFREINISREQLSQWHIGVDLLKISPELTREEVAFITTGEYAESWKQQDEQNE